MTRKKEPHFLFDVDTTISVVLNYESGIYGGFVADLVNLHDNFGVDIAANKEAEVLGPHTKKAALFGSAEELEALLEGKETVLLTVMAANGVKPDIFDEYLPVLATKKVALWMPARSYSKNTKDDLLRIIKNPSVVDYLVLVSKKCGKSITNVYSKLNQKTPPIIYGSLTDFPPYDAESWKLKEERSDVISFGRIVASKGIRQLINSLELSGEFRYSYYGVRSKIRDGKVSGSMSEIQCLARDSFADKRVPANITVEDHDGARTSEPSNDKINFFGYISGREKLAETIGSALLLLCPILARDPKESERTHETRKTMWTAGLENSVLEAVSQGTLVALSQDYVEAVGLDRCPVPWPMDTYKASSELNGIYEKVSALSNEDYRALAEAQIRSLQSHIAEQFLKPSDLEGSTITAGPVKLI